MFDGDLSTKKGAFLIFFFISGIMVIQGLTVLSEELPRNSNTPPPKWDNTPGFLATRHQNDGPLDVDEENFMELTGLSVVEKENAKEQNNSDDKPL